VRARAANTYTWIGTFFATPEFIASLLLPPSHSVVVGPLSTVVDVASA
jgi:hypothetical protein